MSLSVGLLVRFPQLRLSALLFLAVLGIGTVTLVGCGGGGPSFPPPVPVAGTVALKGQPLKGGTIHFVPIDPKKAQSGSGAIQSDGSFKVTTTKPDDGLVPGKYTVFFDQPVVTDGSKSAATALIPDIYLTPALSGLGQSIDKATSSLQIILK